MKIFISLLSMIALSSAMALSTPIDENPMAKGDPVVECGDLEVMTYGPNTLPSGVTPSDVRTCKNHPLGNNRLVKGASLAPMDAVDLSSYLNMTAGDPDYESSSDLNTLGERAACYRDAPYGCSGGYCWKVCNSAFGWCWTAKKGGLGGWYTCSSYKDCKTSYSCGRGCLSCGCGC